jgi:hypothetical protein
VAADGDERRDAAERAAGLTRQLLAFARLPQGWGAWGGRQIERHRRLPHDGSAGLVLPEHFVTLMSTNCGSELR